MTMTDSEKRAYDAVLEKCIDELAADPYYLRDYSHDDIYAQRRHNRHIDKLIQKAMKDAGILRLYKPSDALYDVRHELSRRWNKKIDTKNAEIEEKRRRAIKKEEAELCELIRKEQAEKEQRVLSYEEQEAQRKAQEQKRANDYWNFVAAGPWF